MNDIHVCQLVHVRRKLNQEKELEADGRQYLEWMVRIHPWMMLLREDAVSTEM